MLLTRLFVFSKFSLLNICKELKDRKWLCLKQNKKQKTGLQLAVEFVLESQQQWPIKCVRRFLKDANVFAIRYTHRVCLYNTQTLQGPRFLTVPQQKWSSLWKQWLCNSYSILGHKFTNSPTDERAQLPGMDAQGGKMNPNQLQSRRCDFLAAYWQHGLQPGCCVWVQ